MSVIAPRLVASSWGRLFIGPHGAVEATVAFWRIALRASTQTRSVLASTGVVGSRETLLRAPCLDGWRRCGRNLRGMEHIGRVQRRLVAHGGRA